MNRLDMVARTCSVCRVAGCLTRAVPEGSDTMGFGYPENGWMRLCRTLESLEEWVRRESHPPPQTKIMLEPEFSSEAVFRMGWGIQEEIIRTATIRSDPNSRLCAPDRFQR